MQTSERPIGEFCEQRNRSDGEYKGCERKVTHRHPDKDGDRFYCAKHHCPLCERIRNRTKDGKHE